MLMVKIKASHIVIPAKIAFIANFIMNTYPCLEVFGVSMLPRAWQIRPPTVAHINSLLVFPPQLLLQAELPSLHCSVQSGWPLHQ